MLGYFSEYSEVCFLPNSHGIKREYVNCMEGIKSVRGCVLLLSARTKCTCDAILTLHTTLSLVYTFTLILQALDMERHLWLDG